jgi:hypothetical protein
MAGAATVRTSPRRSDISLPVTPSRRCPAITIGQAVGSGHFIQLEVPDQVNAMIERFLTITGLSAHR